MRIIEYIETIDREDISIHIPNSNICEEECDRCILLISHELSRTGAPQQLYELAMVLIKQGYRPFVFSFSEGELIDDFLNINVITVCEANSTYNPEWMADFISIYDIIFVNTLLLADYVRLLAPVTPRLFWWIHESSFLFNQKNCSDIPDTPSLKIIAASAKTEQNIKRFLGRNSKVINVCVREYESNRTKENEERTVFLWAGSIDYNKAPDLLLRSIAELTQDELSRCDFFMYGLKRRENEYTNLIEQFAKMFPNIRLMRTVPHDELMSVIKTAKAVVVTSNEESTGLVAVEGLMMGKTVICSDGCGVADNLNNGISGLVFRAGDHNELGDFIRFVLSHPQEADKIGCEGRKVYEDNYSDKIYNERIESLLEETNIINGNMNLCSGCGACVLYCPVKAIEMKVSEKGFLYPNVSIDKCIKCGQCRKVCQVNDSCDDEKKGREVKTYAFKLMDEDKRIKSQSGGAFSAFAETFVGSGGIVYGVELTKDYRIIYTEISDLIDISRVKGSKYVQADTGIVFEKVKERLSEGKKVLFAGTSCHIDGLYKYLNKEDISNLYTCDLVCHGVPSIGIFEKYINYQKTRFGEIEEYDFRDKSVGGWHLHIETWKGKESELKVSTEYTDLFYSNLTLRECCYSCNYASFDKPADITIGDFWGIENILPDLDDNKGISLVIIRSCKGNELLQEAKSSADIIEVPKESCIQPNLLGPTKRPMESDRFWNDNKTRPYRFLLQSYTGREYNKLFQKQIISYLNNKKEVSSKIAAYLSDRHITVSGICGDDYALERYFKAINQLNCTEPIIINVFDDKTDLKFGKQVTVEEYRLNFHLGKVVVLDEMHFESYLSELKRKGIKPEDIIPISFILDEEV